MKPVHLARRFFGSLRPGPPSPGDEAWVAALLTPGEHGVWSRLGARDRRHLVGVAREVDALLSRTPYAGDSGVVVAALSAADDD